MKKSVWVMNHYAGSAFFDRGGRHYNFAKYLRESGYEPVVFCANSRHGKPETWFPEGGLWQERMAEEPGVPFVFVKARTYMGNGKQRILNMLDFYRNVRKAAGEYAARHGTPDVIYASSVHPLTLLAGIRLAKRFGVRCVCEVRDLWPESLVSYGVAGPRNPAVIALRRLEKWLYKRADALVFTMGGAYDYILEQGWEKDVPRSKVFYINNGIDLESFQYNREHFQMEDPDLEDPDTFKVIYTGSLRKANELGNFFNAIALMRGEAYSDYRFLIYGGGDSLEDWKAFCAEKGVENIRFKGRVDKKYIPYILSKGDLNVLNVWESAVMKYGDSQNKLFEYFASGHPVLSGESGSHSLVTREGCGLSRRLPEPEDVVRAIVELRERSIPPEHIRAAAAKYDFRVLTDRLREVLEGETGEG